MAAVPQTLRQGARGADVSFLQHRLNRQTPSPSLTVDGAFGNKTRLAVCSYQRSRALRGDGVAGPATWDGLLHPAVYYRQGDARWAKEAFTITGDPKQTIASSGCGPVAMAISISSLGAAAVLPPALCRFAIARGHRTPNNGTGWGFFHDAAREYGLSCHQTASLQHVEQALAKGGSIIANMGPGMFTKAGHYITLRDQNPFSGEVYVLDPASAARTKAPRQVLLEESKMFFILFRLHGA